MDPLAQTSKEQVPFGHPRHNHLFDSPPTGMTPSVYGHSRSSTQPQDSVRNAKADPVKGGFGPRLVAPLRLSAKRRTITADRVSLDTVCRKVRALLNKLAVATFDSISDQIIEWANMPRTETDARTLEQIIQLVYGMIDENEWLVEMLARLCRKMMEQIRPEVQDSSVTSAAARAGLSLVDTSSINTSSDSARKISSEAGYRWKLLRLLRGLDLIKFIGELFKLQMLTERIMHECVKKMLGNVDNPEEEEIEGLCELLSTVGQLLDMPKARAHMDVYFLRMKDSIKSANVTSRVQFMVQDIIELRQRGWVSHSSSTVPTTQVVHELLTKMLSQINENFNELLDLVLALVLKAIESREADAILIADLFARAISKNLCTRTAFEQGFSRVAESLEDVVIDAPEAWDFVDIMVKGAGLTEDSRRWIMPRTIHVNKTPFFVAKSVVDGSIRSSSTTVDINPAEEVRQIYSLPLLFGHLICDGSGIHDNKEMASENIAKDAPGAQGITVCGMDGVAHSGSTPSASPAFTAPQWEGDDTVNMMQHNSHDTAPSNMRRLDAGQMEEYRALEASWSREVEFLHQQVVVWQELYKRSAEERKDVTIQYHLVDQSDANLPSEL
ncbi:ARM repeat-containing protein [Pleurotus eryngii]|uniref:ARM repeat-containing protein n=1 Tax=Pleurotus eryngii TaxID=5323 RepID=A0A9P6AB69_PLEER|nr:ARM repeat-containing protein [Pleurotus eryngii]